jgi:CTP-dependent riboflavin kinase
LLKDKLGINSKAADIDAAHILPKQTKPDGSQDEKPPNIIVKFAKRETRDEAIQRRRQLKGSGVVILEDLTQMNVKLMTRVKNHDQIKQTWSQNGKIIGLTHAGRKIRFELFDSINEKIK